MSTPIDLIRILRCAVFGGEPGVELTPGLAALAERHELAHLLGSDGLAYRKSVYTRLRQDELLELVCAEFEKQSIDHLPMKGAVLADYYPQRWMRSSCDIDVLVQVSDFKSACLLAEKLGGRLDFVNSNTLHAGFDFSGPVKLEIHCSCAFGIEGGEPFYLWAAASHKGRRYALNDGAFYDYHIYHMAQHFRSGGCGIRPFLDIAVMKSRGMGTGGNLTPEMEKFRVFAEALADEWFGSLQPSGTDERLIDYIIRGGVYGTTEQKSARGRGLKYALKRLFMPYSTMIRMYPKLEGKPLLLPFYWVKRAIDIIRTGRGKRAAEELKQGLGPKSDIEELMKENGVG